jgi:copper chaperone CopZ
MLLGYPTWGGVPGRVPPGVTTTIRVYDVPAISCGHCRFAIEAEVATVAGVESVAVDIAARTVRVQGTASDESVRAAIDAAGYDVAGSLDEPAADG